MGNSIVRRLCYQPILSPHRVLYMPVLVKGYAAKIWPLGFFSHMDIVYPGLPNYLD